MDRFKTRRGNDGYDRAARQTTVGIKKILVVSNNSATLDHIASVLTQQPDVQLTCVAGAELGIQSKMTDSHDLVILDLDALGEITFQFDSLPNAGSAVICLCNEKKLPELIRSMRGTTGEFLLKPFHSGELLDATQTALDKREESFRLAIKYRKMRELVRRVVRERRDLNHRIELVCRDLVEAHRRLTHRFVELQKTQSSQA